MEVGDDRNYLMGIDYTIVPGLVGVDVVVVVEDSPAEEALGRMDCSSWPMLMGGVVCVQTRR